MDSFGCVVCGNTKNDYEYQAAKLREGREPEVKVTINDEEYSVVSLAETAHTLLHDPAADGVTKGMANAVMALCERVEALHREERMRAEDQARAWQRVTALKTELEAVDNALCDALAAGDDTYDSQTMQEHVEALIKRIREKS